MVLTNKANENLMESLVQRERQERLAMSSATTEVLSNLNISVDNLPQKCQQLLRDVCSVQAASEMDQLDQVAISLCQSRVTAEKLDYDYEILLLRQKNKELQAKIDRNAAVIDQLRRDLAQSRQSLASQTPNPETVQDYCRQMKQKVASYEESCKRAKAKFSTLAVPEQAMPKSLCTLATSLAQMNEEAATLRRSAEEVALVNQARHALLMLKK